MEDDAMTTSTTTPLTRHPAKFSDAILEALAVVLRREQREREAPIQVLDPFAGVGRIHQLAEPGRIETTGIEIEPEWAACHPNTVCGDSLAMMEEAEWRYDAIVTSPVYGNRMSDSHEARDGSRRRSYRHDLGRMPTAGSNATFAWGPRYWAFMARAYRAMRNVVRPGGLVAVNVSAFYRKRALVDAPQWHHGALWGAGFTSSTNAVVVPTPRLRDGENSELRADHEVILLFRQPEVSP